MSQIHASIEVFHKESHLRYAGSTITWIYFPAQTQDKWDWSPEASFRPFIKGTERLVIDQCLRTLSEASLKGSTSYLMVWEGRATEIHPRVCGFSMSNEPRGRVGCQNNPQTSDTDLKLISLSNHHIRYLSQVTKIVFRTWSDPNQFNQVF